jgi:predicted nicotinamide N-methyase
MKFLVLTLHSFNCFGWLGLDYRVRCTEHANSHFSVLKLISYKLSHSSYVRQTTIAKTPAVILLPNQRHPILQNGEVSRRVDNTITTMITARRIYLYLMLFAIRYCYVSIAVATFVVAALQVRGVAVHQVPLRRSIYPPAQHAPNDVFTTVSNNNCNKINTNSDSVYCLAASSIVDLATNVNFLATQVWPSARMASLALERHVDPTWSVCEFGCGPGLPSLTAATLGCPRVIATDLDPFALELVETAAQQQGLASKVKTQVVDLLQNDCLEARNVNDEASSLSSSSSWSKHVDLFVLSDVFESSAVARGAAHITTQILNRRGANVWVFAQTDRAQREIYLQQLRQNLQNPSLTWSSFDDGPPAKGILELWLCDVDETKVFYG